jgi:hypothetical protein
VRILVILKERRFLNLKNKIIGPDDEEQYEANRRNHCLLTPASY